MEISLSLNILHLSYSTLSWGKEEMFLTKLAREGLCLVQLRSLCVSFGLRLKVRCPDGKMCASKPLRSESLGWNFSVTGLCPQCTCTPKRLKGDIFNLSDWEHSLFCHQNQRHEEWVQFSNFCTKYVSTSGRIIVPSDQPMQDISSHLQEKLPFHKQICDPTPWDSRSSEEWHKGERGLIPWLEIESHLIILHVKVQLHFNLSCSKSCPKTASEQIRPQGMCLRNRKWS